MIFHENLAKLFKSNHEWCHEEYSEAYNKDTLKTIEYHRNKAQMFKHMLEN